MNIWITKYIRFGYRYTSDKNIRSQIVESTNWLIETIKQKGKQGDYFILSGGLFYNTNPSIVAINDAKHFINILQEYATIVLVNTSKDIRLFDGVYYSTLDLFNNVMVIDDITTIGNINIVPLLKSHNRTDNVLNSDMGTFSGDIIPNLIQLDETEPKSGLIVFNTDKNKYVFIENKISPKHNTLTINTIEELINLSKLDNSKINNHLTINKSLLSEYKTDVDILLFKINPTSVKYTSDLKEYNENNIIDITNNLSIDDTIIQHLKEDEELLKQFNRIREIINSKNNIEI